MTKGLKDELVTRYKCDLLGRRLAKRVNGGDWWWYFYDGLKVLAEGWNASNNRTIYTRIREQVMCSERRGGARGLRGAGQWNACVLYV